MTEQAERTLGGRLKEARIYSEMSQEDAANAIGTQPITMSRYERNDQDPSAETLVALAKLYSVSTDWLLTNEETAMTLVMSDPSLVLRVNTGILSAEATADISEHIGFVLERDKRRRSRI